MKICKFCNQEYFSVWSKCDDCRNGKIIYTDGCICFICKEKRIHRSEIFKAKCNLCYSSSSINKLSVLDILKDNNV